MIQRTLLHIIKMHGRQDYKDIDGTSLQQLIDYNYQKNVRHVSAYSVPMRPGDADMLSLSKGKRDLYKHIKEHSRLYNNYLGYYRF